MTVTMIDTSPLADRNEPIDFTTDAAAADVRISVAFPLTGADETAYWAGAFTPRYSQSTVTDLGATRAFHVVRTEGWGSTSINFRIAEGLVPHATTHEFGQSDAIAGQKLGIATTFTPVWTPATDGASASSTSMLGAHLKGLSTYLGALYAIVSSAVGNITTNTTNIASNTAAIALKADLDLGTPATYSSTSNTASTADARKPIEVSNASACTLTIPSGMPVRSITPIIQTGAGQLTVQGPGGGVTFRAPTSLTAKARAQYSVLYLYVRSSTEYLLTGDVASS